MTNIKFEVGNVVEARNNDIECVRDMRVYDKTPRAQAIRSGGNIIKTRLIDITRVMKRTLFIGVAL